MFDGLGQRSQKINWADYEFACMLCAAQATQQGLEPIDFDCDAGTLAFAAMFDVLAAQAERETIYVTPTWRRVVIAARHLRWGSGPDLPSSSSEKRYWTYSKADSTARRGTAVPIPTL
jgi:hypothetical protein